MPERSNGITFPLNSVVFIGIVNAAFDVALANSGPTAGLFRFSRTLTAKRCSATTAIAVFVAATPAAGGAAVGGSSVLACPGPWGRAPIKSVTFGAKVSFDPTTSPDTPLAKSAIDDFDTMQRIRDPSMVS